MLKIHPHTVQAVRKLHGLDSEKRLNESLDLLEEWCNKQKHFTKKDFSREYLEHMLIAAKGSVERTKERLDRICTFKNIMPQFFEDNDPRTYSHRGKILAAMLPKLTSDHSRVFLEYHCSPKYSSKMFMDSFKYTTMLMEHVRIHDYAGQYVIILDYRNVSLSDALTHLNIMDFRSLAAILIEGYGLRVKNIHILTDSKFIDILLSLGKQVVSTKLISRINFHRSLDSLHKMVEKDVLPLEYGGTERPLAEINDQWVELMSSPEYRNYWRNMSQARTDESLRSHDLFNHHYMGTPGSFRTLTVD